MTDEEFVLYRDGRYAKAMKYYDDRANRNRCYHRFCSIYVIVVSIAITPLLSIDPLFKGCGPIIAAVLAPTIAVVTGIAAHFRFHENWLSYRATWDALQHEIHWRDAQIQHYKNVPDRNALFVERVEALISSEGAEWLNRHASKNYIENIARTTN